MAEERPLSYPVHFAAPKGMLWPELAADPDAALDEATLAKRAVASQNGWVIRTYYHLRRAGHPVTISEGLRDGAINVAAPREFGRRARKPRHFVVIPRADGHRPMLANYFLEQNTGLPEGERVSSIPYWPQAGILQRDPARTGLSVISFKGRVLNLSEPYRNDAFVARLAEMGVQYEPGSFDEMGTTWQDYRKVDAVVAVRNMTVHDALHKPASKLINAWHAGVPAILGPEPAFQAVRESPFDYIEACNPDEAIAAVRRLREDPDLYHRMVENGRMRAQAFTEEAVRRRWVDVFERRIGPAFDRWKRKGGLRRGALWVWMMAAEPVSRRFYQHYIRNGRRILE